MYISLNITPEFDTDTITFTFSDTGVVTDKNGVLVGIGNAAISGGRASAVIPIKGADRIKALIFDGDGLAPITEVYEKDI